MHKNKVFSKDSSGPERLYPLVRHDKVYVVSVTEKAIDVCDDGCQVLQSFDRTGSGAYDSPVIVLSDVSTVQVLTFEIVRRKKSSRVVLRSHAYTFDNDQGVSGVMTLHSTEQSLANLHVAASRLVF